MSQSEARYSVRALILTGLVTLVGTVLALESAGRIIHTEDKSAVPIGEFRAIHLSPDEPFRMSRKFSELHAVCEQGYLAIASDVDPAFRGVMVDYKNRGVRCGDIHTFVDDPAANDTSNPTD
ncbi:kinase [Marinobacter sp. X15-166B]|uniref:kinase n=1 Tax=Marinobacter sp. X15-166B TaxID=1897620 RepID=UPI00085CDB30|nr:kinase [Marinobacter sp. X15-166B]OEY65240.1 kinase [Marinobacter sp. X15-166B]